MFLRKSAAHTVSFISHALALGILATLSLAAWDILGPPGSPHAEIAPWIRVTTPPFPSPPGSPKIQAEGWQTEIEASTEEDEGIGQYVVPSGVEGGILAGVAGGLVGGIASVEGVWPSEAEPLLPSTSVRAGVGIPIPAKLVDVTPRYPPLAHDKHIEGVVVLEATIDESGRVVDLRVLRSITALDRAAVEAVRRWRYAPAMLGGLPVRVVLTVTVAFSLPS